MSLLYSSWTRSVQHVPSEPRSKSPNWWCVVGDLNRSPSLYYVMTSFRRVHSQRADSWRSAKERIMCASDDPQRDLVIVRDYTRCLYNSLNGSENIQECSTAQIALCFTFQCCNTMCTTQSISAHGSLPRKQVCIGELVN